MKHVLLTTDFSEDARRAYPATTDLCRVQGARLSLLHVVPVHSRVPQGAMLAQPLPMGDPEAERKEALHAMEEEAAYLGAGKLDLTTEVVLGEDVGGAIVRYAEKKKADLIAMSSHGRAGLRRMILGSVTEQVLRRSHVPVLCFPPPAES